MNYLGEAAREALVEAWSVIESDPSEREHAFACKVVRAISECSEAMARAYSASGPVMAAHKSSMRSMDQVDTILRAIECLAEANREMAFALSFAPGGADFPMEPDNEDEGNQEN